MSEENPPVHEAVPAHGEHDVIHMPPNSFVPVSFALSISLTFVGFVDQVRSAVGPTLWLLGLLWLVATCAVWAKAAVTEYRDLPESPDGH